MKETGRSFFNALNIVRFGDLRSPFPECVPAKKSAQIISRP